ncbi:MAG: ribonuclease III [Acidimicrobiaceae bacterium]|nr:ribonuclease III [Acidimicrobiaceae bacterium]
MKQDGHGMGGPLWEVLPLELVSSDLFRLAFTHRSSTSEKPGVDSNERLEFLGDAVLQLVVSEYLFSALDSYQEGVLTKIRATVVNSRTLGEVAASLGVGDLIEMSKGEEASGGRMKGSILADALEAIFGACYLVLGLKGAKAVIVSLLGSQLEAAVASPYFTSDYKSALQERLARTGDLPVYETSWEGPDHQRVFFSTVRVNSKTLGRGSGESKKLAQQDAARATLEALDEST